MKKNNYNQSLDWWTHGLKTYFYHFKSFFKIFNILNKDWKTIFEIIIKYHAGFEFQKQKQLSAFVKSKFEWAKRNKITLYNYQDAIPRSSTMSKELGLEVWKGKRTLYRELGQPREHRKEMQLQGRRQCQKIVCSRFEK